MNLNVEQVNILKKLIHKIYSNRLTFKTMIEASNQILTITGSQFFSFYAFDKSKQNKINSISNNAKKYSQLYINLSDQDYIFDRMVSTMKPTTLVDSYGSDDFSNPEDEFSFELIRARPISDICYVPMIIGGQFIGYSAAARAPGGTRCYTENDIRIIDLCCRFLREGFVRILRTDNEVFSNAVLDSRGNVLYAGKMLSCIFKQLFGERFWENPAKGSGRNHASYNNQIVSFLSEVPYPGSGEWHIQIFGDLYSVHLERVYPLEKKYRTESEPCIAVSLRRVMPSPDNSISAWNLKNNLGLTETELLVAEKIGLGFSNAEIADLLCISEQTVKRHVYNIFGKTGVKKRSRLIMTLNS